LDQLLTIDVLGQPFTFKTDSDMTDAKAVADYMTTAVNRIESQSPKGVPTIDKRAILILTALNITNEYLVLKKKHQELLQDINQRSAKLLDVLDSKLS
jgi:cell division protein ZapA (FtsZ GTPase activity inhibitor)